MGDYAVKDLEAQVSRLISSVVSVGEKYLDQGEGSATYMQKAICASSETAQASLRAFLAIIRSASS